MMKCVFTIMFYNVSDIFNDNRATANALARLTRSVVARIMTLGIIVRMLVARILAMIAGRTLVPFVGFKGTTFLRAHTQSRPAKHRAGENRRNQKEMKYFEHPDTFEGSLYPTFVLMNGQSELLGLYGRLAKLSLKSCPSMRLAAVRSSRNESRLDRFTCKYVCCAVSNVRYSTCPFS